MIMLPAAKSTGGVFFTHARGLADMVTRSVSEDWRPSLSGNGHLPRAAEAGRIGLVYRDRRRGISTNSLFPFTL